MVEYLRGAFGELLQAAGWLDAATKQKAQDKINAMKQFIGYPDWMRNRTAVEDFFEGVSSFHQNGIIICLGPDFNLTLKF